MPRIGTLLFATVLAAIIVAGFVLYIRGVAHFLEVTGL